MRGFNLPLGLTAETVRGKAARTPEYKAWTALAKNAQQIMQELQAL
jgi:hypothetical protein